jgi:hypothetical protein
VARVVEPRRRGDIAEASATQVFEEHVAAADRGDVEVGVAVVVDVCERCSHRDLARHGHAGRHRDVFEPAAARVAPEFVAADLVDKVQIETSVTVYIRD